MVSYKIFVILQSISLKRLSEEAIRDSYKNDKDAARIQTGRFQFKRKASGNTAKNYRF